MSNKIVKRWVSAKHDEFVVQCDDGLYYRRSYSVWANREDHRVTEIGDDCSVMISTLNVKEVEDWIESGELEEV